MSSISIDLIKLVVNLNDKLLNKTISHPAKLALALEEIATDAWNEAKELGTAAWQDVEEIQPCLRIDP